MSYSNQMYDARKQAMVAHAVSFGTTTASSATGANTTPVLYLPKFERRVQVNKVRMAVTTIPDDGSTALKANFLNGTNTFATVALTTATLGQVLDGTVSTSYNTFTAGVQPTLTVTGTATATADAQGSYHIYFEVQELFAA